MLDFRDIIAATENTARDLLNIFGLIEKNVAAYDRIKARFRQKRAASRLNEILMIITNWRKLNLATLWMIGHALSKGEMNDLVVVPVESGHRKSDFNAELHRFFLALLLTRDLIDEYRDEIINVDYRLYEKLDDSLSARIDVVNLMMDRSEAGISVERLRMLYDAYQQLVKSMEGVKDQLQSAAKKLE